MRAVAAKGSYIFTSVPLPARVAQQLLPNVTPQERMWHGTKAILGLLHSFIARRFLFYPSLGQSL